MINKFLLLILVASSFSCSSVNKGRLSNSDVLILAKQIVKKREGWADNKTFFVITDTKDGGWCVISQRRESDEIEIEQGSHRMILLDPNGNLIAYIKQ